MRPSKPRNLSLNPGDALVVNVQNDFLPGGNLAVPRGMRAGDECTLFTVHGSQFTVQLSDPWSSHLPI